MRFKELLAWAGVLGVACAAIACAPALAAKPTVVRAGNLVLRINGGVGPKALPRRGSAPITLRASGAIATSDGSPPPATKLVKLEFDKQGGIQAKGLDTCRSGQLEARTTRTAKQVCRGALVGTGHAKVSVTFPESQPFYSSGPLLLFNGGVKHGVTTMYIHAYVHVPVATALVTVVRIRKIHDGPYGTLAVAKIPKIASGSGALNRFNFAIHREFKRGRRRQSYLSARCGNGRLRAHATLIATGGRISGSITRPCKPRR